MLEARGFDVLWMIARRINFTKFRILTEGMYLALHHSDRTITTETPSEYDLVQRIQAQIAMVQRAIELSMSRCPQLKRLKGKEAWGLSFKNFAAVS
jgi:hypothetical protein